MAGKSWEACVRERVCTQQGGGEVSAELPRYSGREHGNQYVRTRMYDRNFSRKVDQRDLEEAEQEQHDEDLQSFVQVFPDLKRCIRGYIKELRDIADDTDKCQDSSNIIKVKGSSMRMVGAILGLGGVIAAPCTEGISLVLTAVGTGMVIAGNATNFTARVGSSIKRMKKKRQLDEIMNDLTSIFAEIDKYFTSTEPNTKRRKPRKRIKKLITKGLQLGVISTLSILPLLGEASSLVRNVVRYKKEKKLKVAAEMIREVAKYWETLLHELENA
eukprot:gi/632987320/ref/XP_007910727.1/ PREDICTED: uncharacterized protein LOC103191540 isoform X2 [Callorhinchus milii]